MKLDTDLGTVKPLIVQWFHSAWKKLKEKKQMIREGWDKLGFFKILDSNFQSESMKLTITKKLDLDCKEDVEEERNEALLIGVEDGDYSDDEDVEDEDEDEDAAVTLAACIERMELKPTGTRSSSRVAANANLHHDKNMARAMQDSTYDDICYISD